MPSTVISENVIIYGKEAPSGRTRLNDDNKGDGDGKFYFSLKRNRRQTQTHV